jgi:hypothetical protein
MGHGESWKKFLSTEMLIGAIARRLCPVLGSVSLQTFLGYVSKWLRTVRAKVAFLRPLQQETHRIISLPC